MTAEHTRIAVFPGSFDPFTIGHKNIIDRALPLFDTIIIAIGVNADKTPMFELQKRIEGIKSVYANESKIEVASYKGLTVDFCETVQAAYIIRGIRNAIDFEYEKPIAHMNKKISNGIDTIFIACDEEFSSISSSIVRDLYRNGRNIDQFIPFPL